MILDMLKAHQKREKASFHMPGHKNGRGFWGTDLAESPFIYDTTELWDTDALIQPDGTILEAEKYAASLYGAAHSFYLVNGASGGILAMLYAAFRRGDTVLIDRYCHQSVLHGCEITGLCPVYLTPEESSVAGLPGTVSGEAVADALRRFPAAKGLVLTSPNYYGAAADLSAIAKQVHAHGGLLLVDEAHGAHFPFSDSFPQTAMEQGADLSVTSLHKSMPSPNQTALLHMSSRFREEDIRRVVRMFQTSSPSYVLLAAMEQALRYGAAYGARQTQAILSMLQPLGCPHLDDPFKLLPDWRRKGLSGYEADQIFRERFGIYAELSTPYGLLLMSSWCSTREDITRLQEALSYCSNLPETAELPPRQQIPSRPPVSASFSLDKLQEVKRDSVSLQKAAGRICAAAVAAFPPCIPILLPGEAISTEQIEALQSLQRQGAKITGMADGCVCVVA